MKKRVCVLTGTRAEYGLLKWLMKDIQLSKKLSLQLIVTGAHLSPEHGNTFYEIEEDGFKIDKKCDILLNSDSPLAVSKSFGLGVIGISEALSNLKPDILVLLGDRYEVLSAACAALLNKIPIAHLHGGEATEGLIDEAIRHSVTKISHLHFVSTETYRNRVIQLGEKPDFVKNVGALGIDGIKRQKLLSKKELEHSIDFKFQKRNLILTFHPVTLEKATSKKHIKHVLGALEDMKDLGLIITMPNSDPDSKIIFETLKEFSQDNKLSKTYSSLGQLNYLSCLQYVDGVIGNSSSGLIEVPSFNKGTINIGKRQQGRISGDTVIHCEPIESEIKIALEKLFSNKFKKSITSSSNPYGNGGSSKKIVQELESLSLDNILFKEFNDIEI